MLHILAPKNTNPRPAQPNRPFATTVPLWSLSLLVLLIIASATPQAKASTKTQPQTQCPPSTAQSVWVISTRNAPTCNRNRVFTATLDYWRMEIDEDGCRCWVPSDKDAFLAEGQADIPTCFHIHGNRTSHQEAIHEGLGVLNCLKNQAAGQKFRMAIWSWPSARIRGSNRNDARVKAARSDVQAYYFARCTQQLNPEARVGMIGYSFGARVITGALELLAGGGIAGYRLAPQDEMPEGASPTASVELPQIRIALIASASDRCWLLPGRRNGAALDLVDWALITCNRNDPILRWYPKMYGCSGPQASGFSGPALTSQQREKTEVLNMSCSVGKSHDWQRYLRSSRLYWQLGECVFAGDLAETENGPEKKSE